MADMQSTDQAQITQGRNDGANFLKSIEMLEGIAWDRAVQDRINSIEYSQDDYDSPLTARDRGEIKVLDQALKDAESDRFTDAQEAGERHDEWMDELTIQANAYPESDMPK